MTNAKPGVKPRVLMVDDERIVVNSIGLLLERNGIDVHAYCEPTEVVKKFRAGVYDLVILDIKMPGMDGFQLYRELRKVDKEVKICFLTAFDVRKVEFKALFPDMVVCRFLTKPVEIGEILKEVRSAVFPLSSPHSKTHSLLTRDDIGEPGASWGGEFNDQQRPVKQECSFVAERPDRMRPYDGMMRALPSE